MTKKERAKIKAEIRAEIKNKKLQKTDGLGPKEIQDIRKALRLVWQRSPAWKLVKKRCTDHEGFLFCEKCHKKTPQLKIDHIKPCGTPLEHGYIERLMVPSKLLMGMCKDCHDLKTKKERKALKKPFGLIRPIKNLDWGF